MTSRSKDGVRDPAPGAPSTGAPRRALDVDRGRPPRIIDLRTPAEVEADEALRARVVRKRGLIAVATLAGLQFGDVVTTDALAGHADEVNPVADYLLERAALLPVKLAVVGLLALTFLLGWRQIRPRVVTAVWIVVGLYGVVVISNFVQVVLVHRL